MNGKQAKRARKIAAFHPNMHPRSFDSKLVARKVVVVTYVGEDGLAKKRPEVQERHMVVAKPGSPRWRYNEAKKFFRNQNHIQRGELTAAYKA